MTMLVGGAVAILAQDPETGHIGEARSMRQKLLWEGFRVEGLGG